MTRHTARCDACRDAIAFFEDVEESFAIEEDDNLQANPAIQQLLRRKVAGRRVVEKSAWQSFFSVSAGLATTRIPAYQALLASAAVVLMFVFANLPPLEEANQAPEQAAVIQVVSSDTTIKLIDSLNARTLQKVGRTLKDDSLLSGFMHPLWGSELR